MGVMAIQNVQFWNYFLIIGCEISMQTLSIIFFRTNKIKIQLWQISNMLDWFYTFLFKKKKISSRNLKEL